MQVFKVSREMLLKWLDRSQKSCKICAPSWFHGSFENLSKRSRDRRSADSGQSHGEVLKRPMELA